MTKNILKNGLHASKMEHAQKTTHRLNFTDEKRISQKAEG